MIDILIGVSICILFFVAIWITQTKLYSVQARLYECESLNRRLSDRIEKIEEEFKG